MPKFEFSEKFKTAIAIAFVGFCFLMAVYFIFCLHYSTLQNAWELRVVEERGVEMEAKVIKSTHSPAAGKSMESYTLDYEYEVDGKWYSKSKYVHRTYTEGGNVSIKYLPNNPKVSDLPGNRGLQNQWIQMVVFDVACFLGIIIVLVKYWRRKKKEKPPLLKDTGILDDIDIQQ